jgi:hypothetical protein
MITKKTLCFIGNIFLLFSILISCNYSKVERYQKIVDSLQTLLDDSLNIINAEHKKLKENMQINLEPAISLDFPFNWNLLSGFKNEISISTKSFNLKDLNVQIENWIFEKNDSLIIIIKPIFPSSGIYLNIYYFDKKLLSEEIYSKGPSWEAYFGGFNRVYDSIDKNSVSDFTYFKLDFATFGFDPPTDVKEYDFVCYINNQRKEIHCTGNKITNGVKDLIKNLNSGDNFYLQNIKTKYFIDLNYGTVCYTIK